MNRKKVSFKTRVTKAFKDNDGNMHVIAIASDDKPDCELDRMSERCIEGFVKQCKNGIDILDNHRSTFPFGRTVDAWKEEEADRISLVVDIQLDHKYPQSVDLFQGVSQGEEDKQLSIGGWLDPDAGIEYEFNSAGQRVRVINGIELDHIAITRPQQACNSRAGFLSAMIKDVLGSGTEFNKHKYEKLLLAVQKQNGDKGQILSGITGDSASLNEVTHFHEFAMFIDEDGVVSAGETGTPINFNDQYLEPHTHIISSYIKTDEARDHHHILLAPVLELGNDNRLDIKVFSEDIPEELKEDTDVYSKWGNKVFSVLESDEMSKDMEYFYAKELSNKMDSIKDDSEKFRRAFDTKSVNAFIENREKKFNRELKEVIEECIALECNDMGEGIEKVSQETCFSVFDYGILLVNAITGKDVKVEEEDLEKLNTLSRELSLDIERDFNREAALKDIPKEKLIKEFNKDYFAVLLESLKKSFSKIDFYDEDSATFVPNEDYSFSIKGVKVPIPCGDIEDVILRVSVLPQDVSGKISRIKGNYSLGKTSSENGHFHKYILRKDGEGIALNSLGHIHNIKDNFIKENLDHIHKLGGDNSMTNIVPFTSVPLAEIEHELEEDSNNEDIKRYAWHNGSTGAFLHHNSDGEAVLRNLIVCLSDVLGLHGSKPEISSEEAKSVVSHLSKHFEDFSLEVPNKIKEIREKGFDDYEFPEKGEKNEKNNFIAHFETQGVEMLWFDDLLEGDDMGDQKEDKKENEERLDDDSSSKEDDKKEESNEDIKEEDSSDEKNSDEEKDEEDANESDEEDKEEEKDATGDGQGQGNDPSGTGGTDTCYCSNPDCDYSEPHERGEPCNDLTCSECGAELTGVAPEDVEDSYSEEEVDSEKTSKSIFSKIYNKLTRKSSDDEDESKEDNKDEDESEGEEEKDGDDEDESEGKDEGGEEDESDSEDGSEDNSEEDSEKNKEDEVEVSTILNFAGFREAYAQARELALGGVASTQVKDLFNAMDEFLAEKDLVDKSGMQEAIEKSIQDKVEAVLTDVLPNFVKSMEDIAKAVANSDEKVAELTKGLANLENRLEDLETLSGGSRQEREDGSEEDEIDDSDNAVFGGIFDTAAEKALRKRK